MKVGQIYKVVSKNKEIETLKILHISADRVWYDKFNNNNVRKNDSIIKAEAKINKGEYILISDSNQPVKIGDTFKSINIKDNVEWTEYEVKLVSYDSISFLNLRTENTRSIPLDEFHNMIENGSLKKCVEK